MLLRTPGVADDEADLPWSFASARASHTRSLNLPYWVPDWHSHDKSTSSAPSSKPWTFHTEYEVSQDFTNLTLNGYIFDEVISLSEIILPFCDTLKGENINLFFQQRPDASVLLEPTGETVRVMISSLDVLN
jgi:hypothetical protein